jgi:ribonuclease HII
VILDPSQPIDGLADSKQLLPERREQLAVQVRDRAFAWGIGIAEVDEIDRLNILQATLRAMVRAVQALPRAPQHVLVDGNRLPDFSVLAIPVTAQAIVRGDASCQPISAASILAKTTRDALMRQFGRQHPQFTFGIHKGYPTRVHLAELQRNGPTELHRKSFGPVRSLLPVRPQPTALQPEVAIEP